MAFELLNNAQITPYRIHTLVRLVARVPDQPRSDVLALIEPEGLIESNTRVADRAPWAVINAAAECGLIAIDREHDDRISLRVTREEIETVEAFRRCMQGIVLGRTDPNEPNELFNLFSAYYAASDEQVFAPGIEQRFDAALFPGMLEQRMNDPKLNGWRQWATFLGLGWTAPLGQRRVVVVPDATVRLRNVLPVVLPVINHPVPFTDFVAALGQTCPELDGGELFTRCRRTGRGNVLSLMLSNALEVLARRDVLRFKGGGDSGDTWRPYPGDATAAGYSHIERWEAK